jgi:hypothetical protein
LLKKILREEPMLIGDELLEGYKDNEDLEEKRKPTKLNNRSNSGAILKKTSKTNLKDNKQEQTSEQNKNIQPQEDFLASNKLKDVAIAKTASTRSKKKQIAEEEVSYKFIG